MRPASNPRRLLNVIGFDSSGGGDYLIGTINQADANLTSIKLTTPVNAKTELFAFDSDGPCAFNPKDYYGGFGSYNGSDSKNLVVHLQVTDKSSSVYCSCRVDCEKVWNSI